MGFSRMSEVLHYEKPYKENRTVLYIFFITQVLHTDEVSPSYKAVRKNREKNVRNLTWLKISAQSVLNLT